jgi:parvulin-like peptidyl-prolyl isomerase
MGARTAVMLLAMVTLALPTAALAVPQSQTIDRVAAVVNGEVITEGMLRRAARALQTPGDAAPETSVDDLDPTSRCTAPTAAAARFEERVLQCMIDDLVQFQYVRRFPQFDAAPDQVDNAFRDYVDAFESREAFEAALREQQKTAAEVRYDLERQALISNYINLRYRSVAEVGDVEVRRYYEEVLRPEMDQRGAPTPALEEIDDELIEPMLFEMEVNRRVDEWIADLRRRADIVVYLW